MVATLRVARGCAVRLPALRQPSLARPVMRLVHREGDAPLGVRPAAAPRPQTTPLAPGVVDEEDAERWDGMA